VFRFNRVALVALAVVAAVVFVGIILSGDDCDPPAGGYTDDQRLSAMLGVHAFTSAVGSHAFPSILEIEDAVEILRCDVGPVANSRRRRALAKLAAHEWQQPPAQGPLEALGGEEISKIQQAVDARFGAQVVDLFEGDRAWLEYAILSVATDQPEEVFASADTFSDGMFLPAYAQSSTTTTTVPCWRPEEPSRVNYVNPYMVLNTHVSVDLALEATRRNVDPQQWDECSGFWDPPPNATYLATVNPPEDDSCNLTQDRIGTAPSTIDNDPGDPNYENLLFEHFSCNVPGCNAWFKNVLNVGTQPDQIKVPSIANPIPTHLISYWLPTCDSDFGFRGWLDGKIGAATTKVLIDEGWLEVWQEGGRTHVEARKKVEFSGSANTWVSATMLGLAELNEQLGEVACCLRSNEE